MRRFTVLFCAFFALAAMPPLSAQKDSRFPDESAAHALYDAMIGALREARTLSYVSDYRWESKGNQLGHCRYTVRMMKPNFFRVDTLDLARKQPGGTIVGDGDDMWIFWPGPRPRFSTEEAAAYDATSRNVYVHKRTPVGRHSIGHETGLLGAGMSMPVLDPSTFHGYTDSLQPYLTAVQGKGTAELDGEELDVIDVILMKGQRVWTLWLSRSDHLPRKLREVVHVSYDIITEERWRDVKVDAEFPDAKRLFAWTPPEGWKPWRLPRPAERLLKAGAKAPDFNLSLVDGTKTSLSDHRGKVVWLVFWRVG